MKRITRITKSAPRILTQLQERIIGQSAALEAIVPFVEMFQSGLNPEGRPAGIFLLMGPTGTGKTQTVEALAEVIHGSPKNVLTINCGEYQMEHEVAKLIGAPPGYLGHRETQPGLTQVKLNQVMSDHANLAIVLFDEIEKAAPSLMRILLGILDKGILRLGDNTTVQFERTLIFMTSNLGAKELARELRPAHGFDVLTGPRTEITDFSRFAELGVAAAKRHFSVEFINRVDVITTFNPLTRENMRDILDLELQKLSNHISRRMSERRVYLRIPLKTRDYLVTAGFSQEFGARALKRVLHTQIMQPLARLLIEGALSPGCIVDINVKAGKLTLTPMPEEKENLAAVAN